MASRWSEEEVRLLKEHYPRTTANEISSKHLDRTVSSIKSKAKRLGLSKNENFRTKRKYEKLRQEVPPTDSKTAHFIAGFTVGDGSFHTTQNGEHTKFVFKIENNAATRPLTEEIHDFFGVGTIQSYSRDGQKVVCYVCQFIPENCAVVVPFFEGVGLGSTYKSRQYENWKSDLGDYAVNELGIHPAWYDA